MLDELLLSHIDHVTFIKLNRNCGLAYAQNIAIKEALQEGIEYIFLLDQDSELPDNYFNIMIDFYREKRGAARIGLIAPNFFDPGIKMQTRFADLTPLSYHHVECEGPEPREVSFAVASGCMIPASVLRETGPMRSDFFIDHVDSEYSLRLRKFGYKIVVNCAITMHHTIGERTIHKLAGLTIKPNHHGPLRKFYIFRNGTRLLWMYGWRYPGLLILLSQRMIHDLLGILFFERGKTKKLLFVLRGIVASFLPFPRIGEKE